MAKRGRPKKSSGIDEKSLTKMQLRKLGALRKSLGDDIANEAFSKWLATQAPAGPTADPNVATIIKLLEPVALKGGLTIPKTGYIIRRGKGRLIVEQPSSD